MPALLHWSSAAAKENDEAIRVWGCGREEGKRTAGGESEAARRVTQLLAGFLGDFLHAAARLTHEASGLAHHCCCLCAISFLCIFLFLILTVWISFTSFSLVSLFFLFLFLFLYCFSVSFFLRVSLFLSSVFFGVFYFSTHVNFVLDAEAAEALAFTMD